MISQKSYIGNPTGGGWFKRELKFLVAFLGLISFSNVIYSNNTSALFTPTLSASVDQANLQVNGNQVINSIGQTKEIPLRLNVETNNKTGYTATISSSSENTSLVNSNPASANQIPSISSNLNLPDFDANTWGYKLNNSASYNPIPALSAPINVLQTTNKTNGLDSNTINIGMKLSQNLESGIYSNTLIFSFVSNPYTPKAIMMRGLDFQGRLARFDPNPSHVNGHPELPTYPNLVHIKRERSASNVPVNAINLEADNSEAEIKAWYDSATKTVYWYSSAEKIYLNPDCTNMFAYFTGMTDVDLSSFDTSEVEDMNSMFYFNFALEKLDVSKFDTSRVRSMYAMFDNLTSLKELDVSNFNTSNVDTMQYMFYNLNKVIVLSVSHFDVGNVKSMEGMFAYMGSLKSLNLSSFNTSKVTNMRDMFAATATLKSLDLSSFNTEKVRNMSGMFYGSDSLTSLDLSSFNTKNVTNMSYMFFGMDGITTINIVNFDTQNVENMSYLFGTETGSVDHLTAIYVNNNFNTDKLLQSDNIFMNRYQLRGGAGSFLTNPSDADKTWLCIDDPTNGRPGYFTRKP